MPKLNIGKCLSNEEIDNIVYETAKELLAKLETLTSEKGVKPCYKS